MTNEKPVEGQIVDPAPTPAVVQTAKSPDLIIGDSSVERATKVANELKDVVERQKLYSLIGDKKYVRVEGWNTLGALMGVFPEVVEVERLPVKKVKMIFCKKYKKYPKLIQSIWFDPTDATLEKIEEREFDEIAYRAVVKLKTVDGKDISRAEAMCSNLEESKTENDEYAINSMAQTRATGKAFRLAFSWIMAMAGYEATPAEEIPSEGFQRDVVATVETPPKPAQPVQTQPVQPQKPLSPHAERMKEGMSQAQIEQRTLVCSECAKIITPAENDYSLKFYQKALCRMCQKPHQQNRTR